MLCSRRFYLPFLTLLQVKWTRVPDLVEKRRVFLKGGMAWVPSREQSSIVLQEFQASLTKALEVSVPNGRVPWY